MVRNSADVGVPRPWLLPLGVLKMAGAAGLLLGLVGVRFLGIAAATGLVLFFVGAIAAHVRTREYRRIGFPAGFPNGYLAVWSAGHAFPEGFDPFFTQIQRTYDAIGESRPGEWPPRPDEQPALDGEFEESGRFEVVGVSRYLWSHTYTADHYIDLLETFSGHIAMTPQKRERLYGDIRRLVVRRRHGTIERHWSVAMTIGRRR